MPILKNRWMGKYKPVITKRISADFELFRKDAEELKYFIFEGNIIKIVKYFKHKYDLSLSETTYFVVAFIGVYNNGDHSPNKGLWTTENYYKGLKVRDKIVERFNLNAIN